MKSIRSLCLLSAVLLLSVTGCKSLYRPDVSTVPGPLLTVTNWSTNLVVTPDGTNAVPVSSVTLTQLPPVIVTNWVPRPEVSAAVGTIGPVAAATGLPFAGTAGILGTALLSLGAAWLNRQKATSAQKATLAMVTGVEAFRKILVETPEGRALDDKLKDALITHQELAGVLNQISLLVNEHTANTR